jgi:hypothetical protein
LGGNYIANNVGYLTSNRTPSGDEVMTPYYAVEPLLKYISKNKTVWCPCDDEWSAFYNTFIENGYKVIRSSIFEGKDFFTYEPNQPYDIIVTNPPFSKKDKCIISFDKLVKRI